MNDKAEVRMYSPQEFAKASGLSYQCVLNLCKRKEIEVIASDGGHFRIPESQLIKFQQPKEFISREEYEKVLRENEMLKTKIRSINNLSEV